MLKSMVKSIREVEREIDDICFTDYANTSGEFDNQEEEK
jgi:hypothetical protein